MIAITDPYTGGELNVGYYVFIGMIAAFLGFVASRLAIHFYDYARSREPAEDEARNKLAARNVSVGMAAASAIFWVMLKLYTR